MRTSRISQAAGGADYEATVTAMGRALEVLAQDMATTLRSMAGQPRALTGALRGHGGLWPTGACKASPGESSHAGHGCDGPQGYDAQLRRSLKRRGGGRADQTALALLRCSLCRAHWFVWSHRVLSWMIGWHWRTVVRVTRHGISH